jgi:L-fuculokinase
MMEKIVIVLDCGATNVRSSAVNEQGKILAQKSFANSTKPDPNFKGGLIWEVEDIWQKLINATRAVLNQIDKSRIAAVTVTTFGVDGAPVSRSGSLLYPVISWVCQRTVPIMENIGKYIPIEELYELNGLYKFSFNTINKFIWLKENRPHVLDKMDYFLFISSIFLQKLSGEFVTEVTMAGTSMLTDIKTRNFSERILSAIDIENKFPPIVEPGTAVGKITQSASTATGIPQGIPVVATGHDTQFAIFGSGADENQPVLSSGTWEILMVRTSEVKTGSFAFSKEVTTEFDVVQGLYNPGVQWLASGIMEWIKRMFYSKEAEQNDIYDIMISEAEKINQSISKMDIDFLNNNGVIEGLGLSSKREDIYMAALTALSEKAKDGLQILENIGNFKAESVIVVGGGARNRLWNQLKADSMDIPVKVIDQKETTIVGAALFAFAGAGVFKTPQEARSNISIATKVFKPV